mgnify:FL=1
MILDTFFRGKNTGFYIDVGCNEPIRYSNTFLFYLRGWKGINIDANKNLTNNFKKLRPKDIVLHEVISDKEEEVTFYISDKRPAVSTIDEKTKKEWSKNHEFNRKETLKTKTLNSILKKYNVENKKIDFLSIDVEGHDFNVLKSIDLNIYRPKIIIVELHDFKENSEESLLIHDYMKKFNYNLIMYLAMNAYFEDITFKK